MKCRHCGALAVIDLPSHHTAFCETCFKDFFLRQVQRGITNQHLLEKDDRVLVAVSGGKDSLSLMLVLSRLGYNVTGLHIDLAIPKSSPILRKVVEDFCTKHDLTLIVKEMEKEGLAIPKVKATLHRPICSVCGKIKRHYFNKIALEGGFTALATGHNLDDEVARLFSNTMRWDIAYLSDQGPCLDGENGFVRKIKPFWRLSEYETAAYAFLENIQHDHTPCPYSQGASFTFHKKIWHEIDAKMPGRKLGFYLDFLERGRKAFAVFEQKELLQPCPSCGSPTSSGGLCGVCRIKKAVNSTSLQGEA